MSDFSGDLKLKDWHPGSRLVVKETQVLRPRYPVIAIHNHLGHLADAAKYLEEMDKAGVWMVAPKTIFTGSTWRLLRPSPGIASWKRMTSISIRPEAITGRAAG